jgi:DNA-binding GntR family transcriptional regulator
MSELLRDRVYEHLKNQILAGAYTGGERLSVQKLIEECEVSATPIRQALNLLEREDLVEIIPGVGCFVSHLSVRDIQDIFELRLIVEAASAELAASRITDEQLTQLQGFHTGYKLGDTESYSRFLAANRDFHCAVARATQNEWLAEVVGRLLDQMHRVLLLRIDAETPDDTMVQEHLELVKALEARDPHWARTAMVQAIENAREAVLKAIMAGAEVPV